MVQREQQCTDEQPLVLTETAAKSECHGNKGNIYPQGINNAEKLKSTHTPQKKRGIFIAIHSKCIGKTVGKSVGET